MQYLRWILQCHKYYYQRGIYVPNIKKFNIKQSVLPMHINFIGLKH